MGCSPLGSPGSQDHANTHCCDVHSHFLLLLLFVTLSVLFCLSFFLSFSGRVSLCLATGHSEAEPAASSLCACRDGSMHCCALTSERCLQAVGRCWGGGSDGDGAGVPEEAQGAGGLLRVTGPSLGCEWEGALGEIRAKLGRKQQLWKRVKDAGLA